MLILLALIAAGCGSPAAETTPTPTYAGPIKITKTAFQPQPETPVPSPSVEEMKTREAATQISYVTATAAVCSRDAGQVVRDALKVPGFSDLLQVAVYLPPCYDILMPDHGYPVVYLLHGQYYTDEQWIRLGVPEIMDRLIAAGEIPPFIVVMPIETDMFASLFDVAISNTLVPWVDESFNTCEWRACRAIGGISRGGGWSLYTGMRFWQLYSSIGLHSTPPFDGELNRITSRVNAIGTEQMPRMWMDMGEGDWWMGALLPLKDHLDQLGVPYDWTISEGKHDEDYWGAHVEDYLRWYGAGFTDEVIGED